MIKGTNSAGAAAERPKKAAMDAIWTRENCILKEWWLK